MVEVNGRLKMMYMNGAYDVKAWRATNHLKATGERPLLEGIIKKKTPLSRLYHAEPQGMFHHDVGLSNCLTGSKGSLLPCKETLKI